MVLNVSFNEFKNEMGVAYQTAVAKVSEWGGRGVVILKSGTEAALPYLQDVRVAVVSLIALNLLLYQVIGGMNDLLSKYCPDHTDLQRGLSDLVAIGGGVGILAGGVIGFSIYTRLPLSSMAIFGISAATIIGRAALEL